MRTSEYNTTTFNKLLSEGRPVLRPAQRVPGSKSVKCSEKNQTKGLVFVGIA